MVTRRRLGVSRISTLVYLVQYTLHEVLCGMGTNLWVAKRYKVSEVENILCVQKTRHVSESII